VHIKLQPRTFQFEKNFAGMVKPQTPVRQDTTPSQTYLQTAAITSWCYFHTLTLPLNLRTQAAYGRESDSGALKIAGAGPKNTGPKNAGPMMSSSRDQTYGDGKCGTENAGLENVGPGKCGTWNTNNEFHIYTCVTDSSSTCGSLVR